MTGKDREKLPSFLFTRRKISSLFPFFSGHVSTTVGVKEELREGEGNEEREEAGGRGGGKMKERVLSMDMD